MEEKVKQLTEEFETAVEELKKLTEKGIKASSPRARKALQNLRTLSAELRKDVSEYVKTL